MDYPSIESAIEGLGGSRLCPRGLCLVQDRRYRCVCSTFHPRDFRCRTFQEMAQEGVHYAPMTESPFPHDMVMCPMGRCLTTPGGAECNCEAEVEGDLHYSGDLLEDPAEQGRNVPTPSTISDLPESNQRMTRARARALREAEGVWGQAGLDVARSSPASNGEMNPWVLARQRRQRADEEQEGSEPERSDHLRRGSAAEARRLAAKKARDKKLSKLRKVVNVCLAMLYVVSSFLLSIAHFVIRVAGVTKNYLSPYPFLAKVVMWLRLRLFNVRAGVTVTDS